MTIATRHDDVKCSDPDEEPCECGDLDCDGDHEDLRDFEAIAEAQAEARWS